MTMWYCGEFTWRSPARFSWRRFVFPDDAGIGLTPVSAANAASQRSLSGLYPGGQELGDGASSAVKHAYQGAGLVLQQPFQLPGQVLDLLGWIQPTPRENTQPVGCGLGRSGGPFRWSRCRQCGRSVWCLTGHGSGPGVAQVLRSACL